MSAAAGHARIITQWLKQGNRKVALQAYSLGVDDGPQEGYFNPALTALASWVTQTGATNNAVEINLTSNPFEFQYSTGLETDLASGEVRFLELYLGDTQMDIQDQEFSYKKYFFTTMEYNPVIALPDNSIFRVNKVTVSFEAVDDHPDLRGPTRP